MRSRLQKDVFSPLECDLVHGEKLTVSESSIVAMPDTFQVLPKANNTVASGIGKLFSKQVGEDLVDMIATRGGGIALLANNNIGQIFKVDVDGTRGLFVMRDAFLAATEGLTFNQKQYIATKSKKYELVHLLTSGEGQVFLGACGKVDVLTIDNGRDVESESSLASGYLVSPENVVAWDSTITADVAKQDVRLYIPGKNKQVFLRFSGSGNIYVQTRGSKSTPTASVLSESDVTRIAEELFKKKIKEIGNLGGTGNAGTASDSSSSVEEKSVKQRAIDKISKMSESDREALVDLVKEMLKSSGIARIKLQRELNAAGIDDEIIKLISEVL